MTENQKLQIFDTEGWIILESINKKWLRRLLKRHNLVSTEDVWSEEAAIELIDRYLSVEAKK